MQTSNSDLAVIAGSFQRDNQVGNCADLDKTPNQLPLPPPFGWRENLTGGFEGNS
ncbi:MAG: hypothetical protein PVF33_06395 [Candidatus Latescibacterota bacterium]|jgi:hypothetical protein